MRLDTFRRTRNLCLRILQSEHAFRSSGRSFLVYTGEFHDTVRFLGADFAFGVAIGHVKQTDEDSVLVPFIRNYTPLEWWNLNWFIVSIGAAMLCLGTFVIGYSFARLP